MEQTSIIIICILLLIVFSVKAQFNNEDTLIASTFISGDDSNNIYAMAIDNNGAIIVVGHTESSNFPTTTGVISTNLSDVDGDIFISKFNSEIYIIETRINNTNYYNKIIIQ